MLTKHFSFFGSALKLCRTVIDRQMAQYDTWGLLRGLILFAVSVQTNFRALLMNEHHLPLNKTRTSVRFTAPPLRPSRGALHLFFVAAFVAGQSASSSRLQAICTDLKPGIVVEAIAKNSEGDKAGLTEGDVIIAWSRRETKGEIQSPFELIEIETEQEPRGQVTLKGERDSLNETWAMGPDKWGLEARPNLSGSVLATYREGQKLAELSKLAESTQLWRAAAAQVEDASCAWLSVWFLFHGANLLADAREWKESDVIYQEALERAKKLELGSEVTVPVLLARAKAAQQAGTSTEAEKYQQEALKTVLKSGAQTLEAARILESLGNSAFRRDDLVKAEEYYQKALAIQLKLAPTSLDVAGSLNNIGSVACLRGDLAKADEYLRRALDIKEKFDPESLEVARTLNNLGEVARKHGNVTLAWEYSRKALVIEGGAEVTSHFNGLSEEALKRGDMTQAEGYYRTAQDIRRQLAHGGLEVAILLNSLGEEALKRGDLTGAERHYQEALAIQDRVAPNSLDVSDSMNNIGRVKFERGDLTKAENYYRQALTIRGKLAPGSLRFAACLNNLSGVSLVRGDLAIAERYESQALAIVEKVAPSSLDLAVELHNLGDLALDRGDLAKAEEYYLQALPIQEKIAPSSLDMAASFNNLGEVVRKRGELTRAEKYYQQALGIEQKLAPDSLTLAQTLDNLGVVANVRGDLPNAEKYYRQALSIREKLAPGSLEIARSQWNLGNLAIGQGKQTEAEDHYRQALANAEKLSLGGQGGLSLISGLNNNLGYIARERGDVAKAEWYFREAVRITRKLAPSSAEYAQAVASLADTLRARNQVEDAIRLYAEAIDVLDRQLSTLGGSSEVRVGYRAEHASYYSEYADLLIAQKKPDLAFEVMERSRARTLLEILSEAHLDMRQGTDHGMIEKERLLQATLSAKANRKINLLEGEHTQEELVSVNKEIAEVLAEYQELEGQIRSSSPKYAGLTQPKPLSAREVQQELLDTDTVMLDYALGKEHSHVFVVTPTSLDSYELPKRSEIESATRRAYQLLTSWNWRADGESGNQSKAEYEKGLAKLSEMVLGPVAEQLTGKRLLIVADGALQHIPFGVLPCPANSKTKPAVPLVVEHEIVNLPSASVLASLRRQVDERATKPIKEVAILADPVFDKGDPRLGDPRIEKLGKPVLAAKKNVSLGRTASWNDEHLARSLEDVTGTGQARVGLSRLVFSRREAATIMAVVKPGKGLEALDFDASRDTAISRELAQYRIVHFATHGLLDSEHPELSGLVFSLVGPNGDPRDGFLDLEDVYNLTLTSDLVVLSACQTGLGKEITAEGLVGLTRGFMYAGASRVVASLWEVDDLATSELMGAFYKGMLKDGLRPAAALRQAQLELMKQERWSDPYYWAAFIIQGEWK
jgi:CHAT domain-containing protein/Tfp pilus assembly protein PilF